MRVQGLWSKDGPRPHPPTSRERDRAPWLKVGRFLDQCPWSWENYDQVRLWPDGSRRILSTLVIPYLLKAPFPVLTSLPSLPFSSRPPSPLFPSVLVSLLVWASFLSYDLHTVKFTFSCFPVLTNLIEPPLHSGGRSFPSSPAPKFLYAPL